jgi:hypothetical protein
MANKHSLEILNLQKVSDYEGKTDVVKQINFSVVSTDAQGNQFRLQKTCVLPLADLANFTPFDQLTEAQVKQWLLDHFNPLSLEQFYAEADFALETQLNPSEVFVNAPWNKE